MSDTNKNHHQGLFPDGLQDDNGNSVDVSSLKGKILGLYFSAAWCPPCRAFSPVLSEFLKKNEKDFQVVFVSFDNTEDQMKDYMRGKGWPAVTFNSQSRSKLANDYGASMLPTLVILNEDGKLITDWGRSAVSKNPENCLAEWKKGQPGVSWFDLIKFW